ncbi:PRD domain-containing protein [Neobacillus sp. K501]
MSLLELETLIQKSGDAEKCSSLLQFTEDLLKKSEIKMNDAQCLSLVSHLSAMVYRSINKEPINPIDKEMFNEVSSESINLAEMVSSKLPDLHEDEKYLLSIHFESAKMNS